jgi:methanethiol S-methyltransferase
MLHVLAFIYSLAGYAAFAASLGYLLAFLVGMPGIAPGPPGVNPLQATLINLSLLTGFALQHSVMARPAFKRRWTAIVPAAIERSTYVLISSAVTFLLCWWWQPLPGLAWSFESAGARVLWWTGLGSGLLVLFGSSFNIDHFDLLGVRQTWSAWRGLPATSPPFVVRGFYRVVRHPIYVGWLLLFWCTPVMRMDHLLMAAGMTVYVMLAIRLEERDLVAEHGSRYAAYQHHVPALLPRPRGVGASGNVGPKDA